MGIRDERQLEFAEKFVREGERGIENLFVRFGKCRVGIKIFEMTKPESILISYPDNKIKKSWIDEFEEMEYKYYNHVTFTNHRSLNKFIEDKFDLIVLDEVHTLSDAQILVLQEMSFTNKKILGLTGTLSEWTKKNLKKSLDLNVIAEYPIEQAIEEGVVSDYEINVVSVPMDDTILQNFGKKPTTEKKRLGALKWVCDTLQESEKDNFFLKLKMMDLFQNSLAKKRKIMSLLSEHKNERVLVFCGSKEFSQSLGIPYHHSSSDNTQEFLNFADGNGKHMAVIRIGATGKTYKPLNLIIINAIDSNSENMTQKIGRAMAIENGNPDKKSKIYIIVTPSSLEEKWIKKSLVTFDEKKIKYL